MCVLSSKRLYNFSVDDSFFICIFLFFYLKNWRFKKNKNTKKRKIEKYTLRQKRIYDWSRRLRLCRIVFLPEIYYISYDSYRALSATISLWFKLILHWYTRLHNISLRRIIRDAFLITSLRYFSFANSRLKGKENVLIE